MLKKPPFIMNCDAGSFARYTLENRFPAIIDKALSHRPSGSPEAFALTALKEEILEGKISDPFAVSLPSREFRGEEAAAWREEIALWNGRSWSDIPFYFSEAYLYLRILLAAGYYDESSRFYQEDPYGPSKIEELNRLLLSGEWKTVVKDLSGPQKGQRAHEAVKQLLIFMLKGNRVDLSNEGIAARGRGLIHNSGSNDLLVDEIEIVARHVQSAERIDIILDNAGAELVCDLLFTWFVLQNSPGLRVVLHAKNAPMFVSDAMIADITTSLETLAGNTVFSDVGRALLEHRESMRLSLRDHFFWNGPRHFTCLPEDIRKDLAESDLVILKGDANYRRLLEDRHWPHSLSMDTIVDAMPADLAVLRTLKSEITVDVPSSVSSKIAGDDPSWLYEGRWGVVRFLKKPVQGLTKR